MKYTEQNIDNAINERFIKLLKENCKQGIKKLDKSELKHIETIGLLTQAFNTINNSENNLKKYNCIDSCTLLRASLEYMIMAYMIEDDEEIYNEFLTLSNNDMKFNRKYTILNTLLNKFGKKLNKIDKELFYDTTNREREKIITDLYDVLCKYTHASIVVSVYNTIKNKAEKETLRMLLSYNLYFIKIILLKCLNYFNKIDEDVIDEEVIGISILLSSIKIYDYIQKNNINFDKFKDYFYYETLNNKFYTYNLDGIDKMNKEVSDSMKVFIENESEIDKILKEFIYF